MSWTSVRSGAFRSIGIGWICFTLVVQASTVRADDLPIEPDAKGKAIQVGQVPVELLQIHGTDQGLPDNDVHCLCRLSDQTVLAGTAKGLAKFADGKWFQVGTDASPVKAIVSQGGSAILVQGKQLRRFSPAKNSSETIASLPASIADLDKIVLAASQSQIYVGGKPGLFTLSGSTLATLAGYEAAIGADREVRSLSVSSNGDLAVAAAGGLVVRGSNGTWERISAQQGKRSWLPHDVRVVLFDNQSGLWFGSAQGVGHRLQNQWRLFTGAEGLPYDGFTCIAQGENDVIWFGTTMGAIRFEKDQWSYRRSRRWVPDDLIRSIVCQPDGTAILATPKGIGLLERRPMTLAEKAKFFEEEIDKYHRRTPYGYVGGVTTGKPGQKVDIKQHDSDNDGLWTAMYGAGECFAYAATKDPLAKQRATAAFEALKFLSDVTQGGSHPAPKGFPARSILPIDGRNPNDHDSPEHDRERQKSDPDWKIIAPRWPVSADGKWYWKTDTSSDELDGHYFLYALYHDLVAETPEEKARVKQVVYDITSHLIENDYQLIDHDGLPTRWGRFNSKVLDHGHMIAARGLNSLSILSYLKTAKHITGDPKFDEHYKKLVEQHSYAANTFSPKWSLGYGTGNQSDDEMAFMCYYNILRYETDPELLKTYRYSFSWYWSLEQMERCPLFNFIFAALWQGRDGYPARSVPDWAIGDGVDTLKRFPLDRFDWEFKNSHRLDVVPTQSQWFRNTGNRVDGKVVPVDERHFEFWNHNPWRLDGGGSGSHLSDGAAFLLPYYLGKYHGFLQD